LPEPFLIADYIENDELGFGVGYESPIYFDVYTDYIPAKLLLLIFYISSSLGIRLGVSDVNFSEYKQTYTPSSFSVWFVLFLVIFLNLPHSFKYFQLDNLLLIPAFKFVFVDYAFFLALIATGYLNRISPLHFIFLFFTLFIYLSIAGSKASILTLSIYFFFISLYSFKNNLNKHTFFFPSTYFIVLLVLASFIFYFIGDYFRNINFDRGAHSLELQYGYFRPFLRLSYTGLDRYFLAYSWFFSDFYNYDSVLYFILSILKSGLNLFWPGNFYDEYYAQSSMLIPYLIDSKFDMITYDNFDDMVTALNTQTLSLWGYMLIFFGVLGPFVTFFISFIFSKLFYASGRLLPLFLLYLYFSLFAPYGFEVSFFNAFRLFISVFFIMVFLKFFSRFRFLSRI